MTTITEEQLLEVLRAIRQEAADAQFALDCVEATCRIEEIVAYGIRLIRDARAGRRAQAGERCS